MPFFFPVSIGSHEINHANSEVLLQRKAKVTPIFKQSAPVIVSKALNDRDNLLLVLIYHRFFILKEVLQIKVYLVFSNSFSTPHSL